jgi:DNA-binding transcriptional MocR family regulator
VLLESPTYSNAIEAVRRAGARPIGYPMADGLSGADDGWHAADFGRTLDQTGSRLAYLIPEHQNPTGFTMREPTRVAIARELQRRRLTAVVDETLVELDLDTRPGAPLGMPLAALLPDAISIGSASKAFWGGLRVGWIRAPRSLVPRLVETRASLDLGTAAYEQLVVAELLRDPAGVLDAQRERLRGQRDRLIELVRGALPEWEFRVPGGGLSLWVRLPTPSSSRLAEAAEARGLVITPGYRFFVDGGGERYVRLPFAHSGEVLDEAVGRLEEAWRSVGTGGSMAGRMRSAIDLSA